MQHLVRTPCETLLAKCEQASRTGKSLPRRHELQKTRGIRTKMRISPAKQALYPSLPTHSGAYLRTRPRELEASTFTAQVCMGRRDDSQITNLKHQKGREKPRLRCCLQLHAELDPHPQNITHSPEKGPESLSALHNKSPAGRLERGRQGR